MTSIYIWYLYSGFHRYADGSVFQSDSELCNFAPRRLFSQWVVGSVSLLKSRVISVWRCPGDMGRTQLLRAQRRSNYGWCWKRLLLFLVLSVVKVTLLEETSSKLSGFLLLWPSAGGDCLRIPRSALLFKKHLLVHSWRKVELLRTVMLKIQTLMQNSQAGCVNRKLN